MGFCPLACAFCLLSSCRSLFSATFAVFFVSLLNKLITIAPPLQDHT